MHRRAMVGAMMAAGMAEPATAQTSWPAPPRSIARQTSYFPMGTPLSLVTRTQVSTKDNKAGDRIFLEVLQGLSYRGQIVIPAGSVAVAEVARSDRNGHFGRKGKLDIRLLYVDTLGGPVRLRGQANDEGTSGTITSIAMMAFASPLSFLIHGTSARLRHGTAVQAYLADDMRFVVEEPAAASVMVSPDAVAGRMQAGSGGTTIAYR